MPKMHELLAVHDDQKGQATKVTGELKATFTSKPHLFRKKIVTFRPNTEGAAAVTEEQSEIQSTLHKELTWVSTFLAKAIDSGFQIDIGNTQAKADIVLDDNTVLASNVPATSLLQLGKQLVNVRDLVIAMPTLDPAQGFDPDKTLGKGYFKARDVVKTRTKKAKKVLVLAPATDKHPAQVTPYDEDEPIGTILQQEWSSLTTPATKSDVLARIDTLIQAVKKARSRANSIELDVKDNHIGKKLLDYAFQPLA